MIVEFDTQRKHTTRAKDKNGDWWRINGKCLRCGKCCRTDCPDLTSEIVDDQKIMKCRVQFSKPFMCAMYPCIPEEELKKGCGFSWEKE